MIRYGSHASQLIANGYLVIPILPGTKRPAISNWRVQYNPPPERYPDCGIGIVCGEGKTPVHALDVDVTDDMVAGPIADIFSDILPKRVGKSPKTLFMFAGDGSKKTSSMEFNSGSAKNDRVETLGNGQYFVAYGVHPDTKKEYEWGYLSPLNTPTTFLNVLHRDTIQEVYLKYENLASLFGHKKIESKSTNLDKDKPEYDPTDPLDQKPRVFANSEDLKACVSLLDPNCSREQWRNVGFALHYETDGTDEGFIIWDEWSAKSPKYKEGETSYFWLKFGNYTGEPITGAYIKKLCKNIPDATQQNEEIIEPVVQNFFETVNANPSRFVDDPPPLEMVIYNMMPRGVPSMLYAAGGVGKSTLMLNMATRIACADIFPQVTFLGNAIDGGKVVMLTAEDPDHVLNRRYVPTIQELASELNIDYHEARSAVERNLLIIPTFGNPMSLFQLKSEFGPLVRTKTYTDFMTYLKGIENLKVVIIDTKTRYSPSESGNNVIATQEVTHYERMCVETGATVVMLHHTNKVSRDGSLDGMQAYRGGTGTYDGVRAAWFLRPASDDEKRDANIDKDADVYMFDNSKNNWMKKDDSFLIVREGYKFTPKPLAQKVSKEERKIKEEEGTREYIITTLQNSKVKEFSKLELISMCAETGLSRPKALALIENAVDDGLLDFRMEGRTKYYFLTDEGKNHNITLEGV